MEHNSRGNKNCYHDNSCCTIPFCDWIQGADNESNQIKSTHHLVEDEELLSSQICAVEASSSSRKSKETLNPNRGGGELEFHLEKPSSLLDANTIHRRLAHWKTLASARADPTPEQKERHLEEQRW